MIFIVQALTSNETDGRERTRCNGLLVEVFSLSLSLTHLPRSVFQLYTHSYLVRSCAYVYVCLKQLRTSEI